MQLLLTAFNGVAWTVLLVLLLWAGMTYLPKAWWLICREVSGRGIKALYNLQRHDTKCLKEEVERLDADDDWLDERLQKVEAAIEALEAHSDCVAKKATDAYNRIDRLAEMWDEQTEIKEGQVAALIDTCAANKRALTEIAKQFREHRHVGGASAKPVDFSRADRPLAAEPGPSANPHNYASPIALLEKCLPHLDLRISEHNDGKRLHRAICDYLREAGYPGAFDTYYKGRTEA